MPGTCPWRKTLLLALMVLVSLGLALLVLEWLYRLQLVDTYRPELHTFNPPQVLAPNAKPTLLVMGDSFTASRTSYAGILQDTLQEWRVINAAVSGTGVLQALYMAPQRFAQFHPSIFLYQVYVGNDLFDIRYPTNWRTISPGAKCVLVPRQSPPYHRLPELSPPPGQGDPHLSPRPRPLSLWHCYCGLSSQGHRSILSRTLRCQGQTLCAR